MYTQLFPDDQRLLGRAGTRRAYGRPELMAEYEDPLFSTDYFRRGYSKKTADT